MKYTLKKFLVSSKDYSHHKSVKLGATILQDELLFLSPVLNQNDTTGTEDCTAFESVACRYNEKNKSYDPFLQWNAELQFMGVTSADGTDLKTALAVGVKTGFFETGTTIPTDKATAYFFVSKNNGMDLFDSIRTAMEQIQRPISAGVLWMNEWTIAKGGVINDPGKTQLGGHAVKIAGWKQIDGLPYLVIQNSWGTFYGDQGLYYFSRPVVNFAFGEYGIGYWSDDPNQRVKTLGLIQALYQNVLSLLQTIFAKKNGVYPPPHTSLIDQLAQGIFEAEGGEKAFGYHINNPGDIKNFVGNKYVASLGANGVVDGFAQFPDMATGIKACEQLCTDVARNLLRGYPKNCTLSQFIEIYGEPPVLSNYVNTVLKHLPGKVASTKLSDLL